MNKRWLRQSGSIVVAMLLITSVIVGDITPVLADQLVEDSTKSQILSVDSNDELSYDSLTEDFQDESNSNTTSDLLNDNNQKSVNDVNIDGALYVESTISENGPTDDFDDEECKVSPDGAVGVNNYPYKDYQPVDEYTYPGLYLNTSTWGDEWGFIKRQCTSFVAWKLNVTNGVNFKYNYGGASWKDASTWGSAAQQLGILNDTPAVGAIAWEGSGVYGHVAWVAEVNGNNVTLEEYNNFAKCGKYLNYSCRYNVPKGNYKYIHIKDITSSNIPPRGHVDELKPVDGGIYLRGWAIDDDYPSNSLILHVYIGDYAHSGHKAEVHEIYGCRYRGDNGLGNHGFEETIKTSKSGNVPIYVYALDATENDNPCLNWNDGKGTVVSINHTPRGHVDELKPVDGGIYLRGWAIDDDYPSNSLILHVYIGDYAHSGHKAEVHEIYGCRYRGDNGLGNHGFEETIKTSKSGNVPIYVYALDATENDNPCLNWNDGKGTVVSISIAVTGVSLNKSTTSIVAGKTETLTATVAPSNATNKSVTWTSSNTNVATVSNTGVVTARAQGTATITVKTVDGNKTATCKVTVNPAIISVTGVSLNKSSTNIIAGNTESLTATISPSNATNKNVTWTSSNSNVATVTSSGVVTARTEGTADITVKTADGGKSAVCRVSVVTPPQHVVETYSPDGRVGVPYSFTFESDGTKPLTWEVLDLGSSSYEIPKGLTLSSSGVLSGIPEKAGAYQFYITVSNAYGKYGFYCKTAIIGEKLSFSLDSLPKGKVGEYYDITIQPISDTPYSAYINIEGEDESSIGLRAVNGNGLRICGTPTKAGVFTVVCEGTNYDGHSEKRYDLVIEGNIPVTGVELNKSSTTIVAGNTEALRATVTPYDAADKTVTWTSSNTNVATVTADGLVTAKAEGTADIKVKTNDGGKTATCKVRVVTIPGITTSSLPNGRVGESYTISMTASGTTPITWSIISGSLPSGLILDPDGTIYGAPAAAGIYTFSVQAKNSYGSSPAKQFSINVNPSKPVPGPGGDEPNGTDTIIVAGQRIDLKEVCFKNVHGSIDRYVVDDRKFASISKTVLSGTKEGKVTVTAQSKIGRNIYEDVAKCQVTILNRPKLKFSKQLTYVGQVINASDYFTTSDTNVLGATYWESTNPSVVEVTDPISGKLVAHKNGTANISAYFGDKGKNGTFKVSATISVKIPSFQKNEYSVQTGADLILAMKNVTKAQNPTWATENGSVATATAHLDSKGNPTGKVLIKGINYGDTTLIATIDGQKYSCVIHVTAPKISRTALSIKTGRTASLSLQKTKLKKNQIIWKSSNENVATVDTNGKVTGVASGEALIYTTAGGIKNECVVTVR